MDGYGSPNYYCTWQIMEWLPENCGRKILTVRDILSDEFLFGENGIAVKAYPSVRDKLYFLVDDGWDLRASNGDEKSWLKPYLGSCQISGDKFPNYGNTPKERLKTLSDKVKALGWRGLGIWISPSMAYAADAEGRDKDFCGYWKIRLEWCKYADVKYWKVDWGTYDISDKHKRLLYKLRNGIYPELIIENAFVRQPLNKRGEETAFCLSGHRGRLGYSDVLRTYDVTFPLSIPTTLSRVSALLEYPPKRENNALGIINAEDECLICASLGLSIGVMRYDIGELPETSPPNVAFGGSGFYPVTRPVRKQLTETVKAVNWQKYAPAFGVFEGDSLISKEKNRDLWKFVPDQSWQKYYEKEFIEQSAPRVITRNLDSLPVVSYPYPYITASRNPKSGALSIASHGRTDKEKGYVPCPADVYWNAGKLTGVMGIFGYFKSLTVRFDGSLEGQKIYAESLVKGARAEIADELRIDGHTVILDGEIIKKYGLSDTADRSAPAFMLIIDGEYENFETKKAKAKTPKFYRLVTGVLKLTAFVYTEVQRRKRKKLLDEYNS